MQVREQLKEANPFGSGDSESGSKFKHFLHKLEQVIVTSTCMTTT